MSDNATMKNTTIHDMTTGSPARLIMQFMIPMFLGNIFQQFYNIADSIIAGQFLGVRALAAIGSTGSLMFFVTGWLNGLSSGFAILVSQWFGAKEYERMRHYVAMSIYLSAGWAVLMTIGLGIANEPILRLMNYKDSIMPDVKAYMGIIYAGLIVTAAYNALAAFLRALGDSKSPLYFLIISAVINVGLDVAFIIYGGMGVEGCAYATVIAQGISAVLCFIYIVKKFPILHLKKEFQIFSSSLRKIDGSWSSDGITVFYYSDRNNYCTGCCKCLRGRLYGRFLCGSKDSECNLHSIRCFRCNDCNLCGTELGSWKSRPCTTRCALYTDYDSGLQRNCDDTGIFL